MLTWNAIVVGPGLAERTVGGLRSSTHSVLPRLTPIQKLIWLGFAAIPTRYGMPANPEALLFPTLEYTPEHFGMFWQFWPGVAGAPVLCEDSASVDALRAYPRVCTGGWVPAA